MLTPSLAQEIAGHTTEVLGLNVVITDAAGVIIGSGEPDRVGSFHEASVDVIRTGQPAAHNADQAGRLDGVRPGITLPLVLDDDVVGTVGITGAPSRVRRFGLLVRSHTELLMRESTLIASRLVRDKAVADLIRDIAQFDPDVADPAAIEHGARELGYDLRLRRAAIVIDADPVPAARTSAVLRSIRSVLPDQQDVIGSPTHGRFVVLHRQPRDATGPDLVSQVVETCRGLDRALAAEHGIAPRIGIGGTAVSVAELHDSHSDARDAIRLSGQRGATGRVLHIDDFRVHQLMTGLAVRGRQRFQEAVTARLRDQRDWPVLRDTIVAWCESGFHLVNAARALRVHRNTLVYRLQKIERLTGRTTGEHRFTLALYLGCLLDEQALPVSLRHDNR